LHSLIGILFVIFFFLFLQLCKVAIGFSLCLFYIILLLFYFFFFFQSGILLSFLSFFKKFSSFFKLSICISNLWIFFNPRRMGCLGWLRLSSFQFRLVAGGDLGLARLDLNGLRLSTRIRLLTLTAIKALLVIILIHRFDPSYIWLLLFGFLQFFLCLSSLELCKFCLSLQSFSLGFF